MNLKTASAIVIGIVVGVGVCALLQRAAPPPKPPAPKGPAPRVPAGGSGGTVVHLYFPGCEGCARLERLLKGLAAGTGGAVAVERVSVCEEAGERLVEKHLKEADHGLLGRDAQGRLVWAVEGDVIDRERLAEGVARLSGVK